MPGAPARTRARGARTRSARRGRGRASSGKWHARSVWTTRDPSAAPRRNARRPLWCLLMEFLPRPKPGDSRSGRSEPLAPGLSTPETTAAQSPMLPPTKPVGPGQVGVAPLRTTTNLSTPCSSVQARLWRFWAVWVARAPRMASTWPTTCSRPAWADSPATRIARRYASPIGLRVAQDRCASMSSREGSDQENRLVKPAPEKQEPLSRKPAPNKDARKQETTKRRTVHLEGPPDGQNEEAAADAVPQRRAAEVRGHPGAAVLVGERVHERMAGPRCARLRRAFVRSPAISGTSVHAVSSSTGCCTGCGLDRPSPKATLRAMSSRTADSLAPMSSSRASVRTALIPQAMSKPTAEGETVSRSAMTPPVGTPGRRVLGAPPGLGQGALVGVPPHADAPALTYPSALAPRAATDLPGTAGTPTLSANPADAALVQAAARPATSGTMAVQVRPRRSIPATLKFASICGRPQ